jgi:hypothetical protein
MKLYQLFKFVPPHTFMTEFLGCFGLRGLDDSSEFSKFTLRERNTVDKLIELLPEIILYYIPCKAKKYLSEIDEDRAITVMRQLLRLFDYELSKKERVIQKKKVIFYSLQPTNVRPIFIQHVRDVIDLS